MAFDTPLSFGEQIRRQRKALGYSQRHLAKLVGIDFTYLSKLENDRADYPPKEEVICALAKELELNAQELIYIGGRITHSDEQVFEGFIRENYREMPALFRRLKDNPKLESLSQFSEEQLEKLNKENQELRRSLSSLQYELEQLKKKASQASSLEEELESTQDAYAELLRQIQESSRETDMKAVKLYRFISKSEIERHANKLLLNMQRDSKYGVSWPFDCSRVADFLDLGVSYESLPPDQDGVIAAKIFPLEKLIVINEDLPGAKDGFGASTLAHEIGHWVLHVNQDEAAGLTEQLDLLNSSQENQTFFCRTFTGKTPDQSIPKKFEKVEWQAQYFASCLLMPKDVLLEKSKDLDLTSWPDLYTLQKRIGVTISNLVNRLKELDLIFIPEGSKRIFLSKSRLVEQKSLFDGTDDDVPF